MLELKTKVGIVVIDVKFAVSAVESFATPRLNQRVSHRHFHRLTFTGLAYDQCGG